MIEQQAARATVDEARTGEQRRETVDAVSGRMSRSKTREQEIVGFERLVFWEESGLAPGPRERK